MDVSLQFFNYHLWANTLVFNHIKDLPTEIHHQEVLSVFPTLYDTLFHMYKIDYVWLRTLKGESFDQIITDVHQLKEKDPEKGIEKLEETYVQLGEMYKEFIKQLKDVHATITIYHPSYGGCTTSYVELIQHVANHGTYHRGNVTAMLRQLGHQGKPTDYVSYLFEIKG